MNPLLARLAVVRRRYRYVTIASGIAACFAFVLWSGILVSFVDWYIHLPRLIRASALVCMLGGAGALFYQLLLYPLARRSDNLSLALRIEEYYPELNDALASTIQFLEYPNAPSVGDSKLRDKAVDKAMIQARSFDFQKILDYRFLNATIAGLLMATAVAAHFWHYEGELTQTAVLRIVDPFGIHPWTAIDVRDPVTRIAVGQPFRMSGTVDGILPGIVRVEVQAKNPFNGQFETRPEMAVPVKPQIGHRKGTFTVALDVSSKPLSFRYKVLGNDGTFPPKQGRWQSVDVLQPPSFAMLDDMPSPQITLRPPAYTQMPSPLKLSPGVRHLEIIQGTEVEFRAAVDRPLKEAWIEVRPSDATHRIASITGLIANPNLMPQMSPAAFQSAFPWFVPVELDATRMKLSATFRPWLAGSYALHLVDDNGLPKAYEAEARVQIDPLPNARLQRPSANGIYVPTAEIPFRMLAEDDVFAVKSVYLEIQRKNPDGTPNGLPSRMPLYEPKGLGDAIRAAVGSLAPFERIVPPQPRRLELAMVWGLKKQFQVGDIVSITMCADDYCDLFTPRLPGRSSTIEMRIVAEDELAQQLENKITEIRNDMVGIKKIEEEAQKKIAKLPKDQKADAKVLDELIEAAQEMKQAQERIGMKSDEGVRDKLDKMQQAMKDNKFQNPEMQDQIRVLAQELERLVQEEFPKVEQDLNEARKQAAGATPKNDPKINPKNDPKGDKKDPKSPLEKAQETSKEIDNTLSELTRSLDKWAGLAEIKGKLRDLIQQQKELADATAKANQKAEDLLNTQMQQDEKALQDKKEKQDKELADKQAAFDKEKDKLTPQERKKVENDLAAAEKKIEQATENERKEMEEKQEKFAKDIQKFSAEERKKLAAEQQALEKEMKALLEQMRTVKETKFDVQARAPVADGDKEQAAKRDDAIDASKKLANARGKANSEQLNRQMQEAAKNIDENKMNEANQQQKNAGKTMQQMLNDLEGKKNDDIERLAKKKKDVEKVLEKLDEVQNQADKRLDKKNAPNNPEANAKRAKDMRDEADKLDELARRLMRLNEPKAARALEKAADELREGANKAEAGEPVDDIEQHVQDRLDKIGDDLEHLQQELAREQLAQIGDRLKGLKERQDAAVEQTKELHTKLLAREKWSIGLMQSLDGNRQAQSGLAKETQTLEEKLKGAMVFEHILKKAGKAMEEAATAMAERKELARDLAAQNERFNKEQLDDEKKAQDKILKQQKLAADRLDRLLEALKNEPPPVRQAKNEPPKKDGEKNQEEKDDQGQGMQAQDGIPPNAQIKALKGEQIEVKERTKEFAERHPNVEKLNDQELRELRELTEEQSRLRQLFEQMTAPRDEKGGQP